ncbi:hypothetical protein E0765_04320 [Sulfuricurvum sp. IAE1]|jgi:uncharacterized protein|uniref:PP0621 family protein n=1 Tax=Sulfuricurvum sp. IAE1 TaxID=2546102 RepID=UPI00104FE2A7|nr:PP0621 family protein [Sulfuricurvum sp. IAE1]MDX9967151.1 PP0621 family protein [Sulfuricurvum sp.]TDA67137.1 hypothetical protein E0765_04320 [Sulfuricurvum sp. IAE1]
MLKLLLLVGVIAAVYFIFFKKKSLTPPPADKMQDEAMVPCAKCDTYVQVKEAFMKEGKYYCSRECMED